MWSILVCVLATAGSVVTAYTIVPSISDSALMIRDYSLTDSSPSMTVNQGSSGSSTVSVASINGFDLATGLGAAVSGSGGTWLTATLNPTVVTPSSGGTASSVLTVSAAPSTPPGSYSVQISSSGGTRSHTTTIAVTVVGAIITREALAMDSSSFSSSTNVTLYIRNTGTATTTLSTYYVKDSSGNQYANVAWSGPTISVNQVIPTSFPIGASCSGCTLTGTAFTFVAGNSYTIVVVTSRNNQFAFVVTW